jgi:hypothetical protein
MSMLTEIERLGWLSILCMPESKPSFLDANFSCESATVKGVCSSDINKPSSTKPNPERLDKSCRQLFLRSLGDAFVYQQSSFAIGDLPFSYL